MDAGPLVILTVSLVVPLLIVIVLMSWPSELPASSSSSPSPPVPVATSAPAPSVSLFPPAPAPTFAFSSPADENFFISRLLDEARTSLSADRPMHALSLVLAAVRQQRGEEGVFDALNAAREGYGLQPHANPVRQAREAREMKEMKEDADVDALMSGMSLRPVWTPYPLPHVGTGRARIPAGDDEDAMDDGSEEEKDEWEDGESVLEERGEGALLDEALRDREQFATCSRCRGVIARSRMQQHRDVWCEATSDTEPG